MVKRKRALSVWMNGRAVGEWSQNSHGALRFQYLTSWLNTPGARPLSLSLPLRAQPWAGEAVFNYFDNLLPDNRGIRDRIQARFRAKTSHPFDLLECIGADCVGAIQIVPAGVSPKDVRRIEGVPLKDSQISRLLKSYRTAPLGMREESGEDEVFRISIAGAQEKTALLWKDGNWHRPVGPTPTTHILKLPIGQIEHSAMDLSESCENEWLCLKIAEAFGLPVCRAEVATFDDTRVLVVERFDRRKLEGWIARLPQEDFCQVMGVSPNLKYESDGGPGIGAIMRRLLQSREASHDRALFFKSQVLFWLLAAIDGHAKNFSVFIEPEGRFRMTPLYDIMSAYPLLNRKQLQPQKIRMAMALTGQNRHYHWHGIQPRHFFSTAKQAGFNEKKARALFAEMMDTLEETLLRVEAALPSKFPDAIASPILTGTRQLREQTVSSYFSNRTLSHELKS